MLMSMLKRRTSRRRRRHSRDRQRIFQLRRKFNQKVHWILFLLLIIVSHERCCWDELVFYESFESYKHSLNWEEWIFVENFHSLISSYGNLWCHVYQGKCMNSYELFFHKLPTQPDSSKVNVWVINFEISLSALQLTSTKTKLKRKNLHLNRFSIVSMFSSIPQPLAHETAHLQRACLFHNFSENSEQ